MARGPMLFGELRSTVGGSPAELREALDELVRMGYVHKRRSGRFWVYWLDGNGHIRPDDWELVEGLTVLQVLSEASRPF